ncbi:MAG: hypothetical protein PHQ50_07690, partial [Eubacteriales bacterium]|nr:hypothetical protein [Eubacteriales bacterium]
LQAACRQDREGRQRKSKREELLAELEKAPLCSFETQQAAESLNIKSYFTGFGMELVLIDRI